MKKHIWVKEVLAEPMTRAAYNIFRGWGLSGDEDGTDEGFLTEDVGGGPCNVKGRAGYVSWLPLNVFNRHFRSIEGMTFGLAIEAAKAGKKIARAGWNGKNMFVVYMSPLFLPPYSTEDTARKVNDRTAKWIGEDTPLDSQGYFAMFTAQGQWQPGWLPSQADIFAEDWTIVE